MEAPTRRRDSRLLPPCACPAPKYSCARKSEGNQEQETMRGREGQGRVLENRARMCGWGDTCTATAAFEAEHDRNENW